MPNIGWTEVLIILAILVVIFGTSRLPKLGRSLGQSIRGFRAGLKGEDEESASQAQISEPSSDRAANGQPASPGQLASPPVTPTPPGKHKEDAKDVGGTQG